MNETKTENYNLQKKKLIFRLVFNAICALTLSVLQLTPSAEWQRIVAYAIITFFGLYGIQALIQDLKQFEQ